MKKNVIYILLFVTLVSNVRGQNKIKNSDNYKFSVVIDMNHLNYSNNHNYKYIINRDFILDEDGLPKFLEDRSIYIVRYKYLSPYDKSDFCRESIDTTVISLSNRNLESICNMTKDIFYLNSLSVNCKGEEKGGVDYDGEYALLSFELKDYSVVFKMEICFDENMDFQVKFRKLLKYIESIRKSSS
jgi:hypothetical protein